jgi:dTDP-4-amino-4,6-dideoxygalactose transaminase
MASVTGMFVPTYQGLSATDFVRPWLAGALARRRPGGRTSCFPFDVTHRLSFYRARNAIYHLFRELVATRPGLTVLAPDYYSGNEILAIRAAGATIHYCPVDRNMQLDPETVQRLCTLHNPDVLYVIHYVGWPQPMASLVDLCQRREMLLVEDCALSLLSEMDDRPLGAFGDWSVFCLYKTLPLPNGALLVQNTTRLEALERLRLRRAGSASVAGRAAELLVQRIRGRANGVGAALQVVKRGLGRAAGALEVERANVGDIGFNLEEVDLAMSPLSHRLLDRLDFAEIKRRRVENYRSLAAQLDDHFPVFPELADGVCPLFFPILVADKHAAAAALQQRGVDALEFWNDSVEPGGREMSSDARFLREHVLELPIHQDLTPDHIAYVARQVSSLNFGTRSAGLGARGSAYESPSASSVSGTVA